MENTTKSNGVVVIDTPDGPKPYRKLSVRIPEFLRDYPVKEGFRILVRQLDALSYQKGLLELYQAAIRAGKKPSEVGLPEVQPEAAMVFEAVLVDRSGETLATATAVQRIREFKDWERGETAARQRLLAALGYGGDILDEDEAANLNTSWSARTTGKAEPPPATPAQEPTAPEKVSKALLKQLERHARLRGVPVPQVDTVAEALQKLEELRNAEVPAAQATS